MKEGQSFSARQGGSLGSQPSGLLLSLDIDATLSDLPGGGKLSGAAAKSKQEMLLQSLEQKQWLNMEELAVRSSGTRLHTVPWALEYVIAVQLKICGLSAACRTKKCG